MNNKIDSFGNLFKKFRLRSGLETLSDFGNALAEEGFIYENSLFSHWQKNDRIPHDRKLLLAIIKIFMNKGGVSTTEEANIIIRSVNQRDLTKEELLLFSGKLPNYIPFTVPVESPYFIGREKYLKEISWPILNKKTVLIYGESGVGKTCLAIKIAHILKDKFMGGVLWYRFDIKKIDDILIDVAHIYGEDISKIKDKKIKSEVVKGLLTKKNALLILDNIECFDEIGLFFPDKNIQYSLLMTSKLSCKPKGGIKYIKLRGFNEKELLDLSKKILGLPFVLMNIEKIKQFGKLIDYSPLAATILLKRIENAPNLLETYLHHLEKNIENVYRASYDNKTLRTSLDLSFSLLPTDVQSIFVSLGVFHGVDFSKEAVAYINSISNNGVYLKLCYLRNLSLIEYSKDDRWRLHSLVKLYIKDKLKNIKTYESLASYYVELLSHLGRGNFLHYGDIRKDIDNILEAFKKCYELGYYKKVIELWEYLGIFLWDTGRWKDIEKYGQIVCNASLRTNDKKALAKCFIRELCWLHYWRGDIEKAEKNVHEGVGLAKELSNRPLLALAWIRMGKICQSQQKSKKAFRLFKQALSYYRQENNLEKQGDIFTYIGETYWLMGKITKAKYYLNRALRIVNKINDISQKLTVLSRLGCISLQEKHYEQAIAYFKQSLFLEKRLGRKVGDTFWNNLALGLTYEILKNHKLAREKFQLAKREMVLIGFTDRILDIDVFPKIFKNELARSNFF